MLKSIHDQAIIDLIREDDQVVLARNLNDLFEHFTRIERAGRVIGIDDDDRLGTRSDLLLDIIDIGIPFCLFVADIMYGRSTSKRHAGGPQRIIR